MPELLDSDSERVLMPGDVVMCSRALKDKKTKRPLNWKFFMVVTEPTDRFDDLLVGMIVGTTNELFKDKPLKLSLEDDRNTVHFLHQDEWPDGVHAFRMALILQRKIENL